MLTNILRLRFGPVFGLVRGLVRGLVQGLVLGLGYGLVYGPVQGLNYDWLGFIVACISQVFKGSIASLKCSCFLGDKTSQLLVTAYNNTFCSSFI